MTFGNATACIMVKKKEKVSYPRESKVEQKQVLKNCAPALKLSVHWLSFRWQAAESMNGTIFFTIISKFLFYFYKLAIKKNKPLILKLKEIFQFNLFL